MEPSTVHKQSFLQTAIISGKKTAAQAGELYDKAAAFSKAAKERKEKVRQHVLENK